MRLAQIVLILTLVVTTALMWLDWQLKNTH